MLFKKNKVARHQGRGRITGTGRVVVEGGAEPVSIEAKNILIATGSKSASLRGVNVDGDRIGTSTEALSWPEVPGHLVVIGAGYIGLELGSVWLRLGSKVTVVEYLDRILPGMDAEIATEAFRLFKRQGMEFRLGQKVTGARPDGKGAVVECEGQEPLPTACCSVGRVPNTDGLGLEAVGLKPDDRDESPSTSTTGRPPKASTPSAT